MHRQGTIYSETPIYPSYYTKVASFHQEWRKEEGEEKKPILVNLARHFSPLFFFSFLVDPPGQKLGQFFSSSLPRQRPICLSTYPSSSLDKCTHSKSAWGTYSIRPILDAYTVAYLSNLLLNAFCIFLWQFLFVSSSRQKYPRKKLGERLLSLSLPHTSPILCCSNRQPAINVTFPSPFRWLISSLLSFFTFFFFSGQQEP